MGCFIKYIIKMDDNQFLVVIHFFINFGFNLYQ